MSDYPSDPWVVRHMPSETWWRANRCGYTVELVAAGIYTEDEAKSCERTRSPLPNGTYEDKAMRLSEAMQGLGDGTVGALLARANPAPQEPPTYVPRSDGLATPYVRGERRAVRARPSAEPTAAMRHLARRAVAARAADRRTDAEVVADGVSFVMDGPGSEPTEAPKPTSAYKPPTPKDRLGILAHNATQKHADDPRNPSPTPDPPKGDE